MLNLNEKIIIKFLDIFDEINKNDLSYFIDNILNNRGKCSDCIRIVKCIDDKYIVVF